MAERMKSLVDYFKMNIRKGYPDESLKWALIKQGHLRSDISRALEQAKKELSISGDRDKEKPKIKYELFDAENNPIKIETRKGSWIKRFFRRLFSG